MDFTALAVGVILGLLVAGIAVFLWCQKSIARLKAEHEDARQAFEKQRSDAQVTIARLEERITQVERLESEVISRDAELAEMREEISRFREERKSLEVTLQERDKAFAEQKLILEHAERDLREAFASLSSDALRKNNQSFLELAKEAMETQQTQAKGELEKRQQAIEELVKPLKESLTEVRKSVGDMEEKRVVAYTTLDEQIKNLMTSQVSLQNEARNLSQALKSPTRRGQWGQYQLEKLVEMAGMIKNVDFSTQESVDGESGKLRPDMVVRLPGNRIVPVDAKAVFSNYLEAQAVEDDGQRSQLLDLHARDVKTQLRLLASKEYQDSFDSDVDLVVMFLPLDSMYAAAQERDPQLLEFAIANKIIIATPTLLLGLLRAFSYGWRQEQLAADSKKIADQGLELYKRMSKMLGDFAKVGKNLDQAARAYNDMVGSLDRSVMPAARKMKALQATTSVADLEDLKLIESKTRAINSQDVVGELPGGEISALPFDEEPGESL